MIIAVGIPRCCGYSLQQAVSGLTGQTVWHSVDPDKLHIIEDSAGTVECWLPIPYLRRRFPSARFILNVRDEQNWAHSVRSVWHQRHLFNNPLWKQHEDSILDYAHDYLDARRRHLEGTDYLLWDIERNPVWEPLAIWLGLPVPDAPFPHVDKLKPVPTHHETPDEQYTSLSYF